MSLIVREAALTDAQLVADLTRACWSGRVAPSSSGHRESAELVRRHLQDGGGFVMLLDGHTIGSVRWLPLDDEPGVWEMLRMGVLPSHRGQGLSRHLLEAVIDRAQDANVKELRLAVRADQPRLLDFYAAFHFDVAPELEYTHANPAEPAPTVMRRML